MSSNNVRLRLRAGANEIEIEAPLAAIKETIDFIPEVARHFPHVDSSSIEKPTITQLIEQPIHYPSTNQQSNRTEIPEIRIEKDDSLADVITKIFRDSWGRQPRKLNQVREVLESYGLIHPKQSIAVALLRLAQSARLRRFKGEDGEFVYTASAVMFADTVETGKD